MTPSDTAPGAEGTDGAPRLRFAPSPTGYLHIGGARTALFNWLWARRQRGSFVLRVEDTDQARSTDESLRAVLDSMRWLGLDWDEGPEVGGPKGPYLQTERREIYRAHSDRLLAEGKAFRCWATKEEIAAAREAHRQSGSKDQFKFRSPWRDRPDGGDPDAPHVIRFRAPDGGSTGWKDLVKGPIEYPNATQQDFVLLRSDGLPLYNFGAVVDDATMGITVVARGDDHLVNTPAQILLYRAFGWDPPAFAHLPMILAPNGEKLSKRHAAVSVLEYRDMGYLPDGVLNYLARLGWSHGDQEIFSRDELVSLFDWSHVGTSGAKYDAKKFEAVQAAHLRGLDDRSLAAGTVPFLAANGIPDVAPDDPRLLASMEAARPRSTTFADVAEQVDFYFREPPAMDDKAARKFLVPERAPLIRGLRDVAADLEGPFTAEALEARVAAWLEDEGLKMKDVAQPARVALTGRTRSPGLFEVMAVLGRDATLERLARGAEAASGGAGDDGKTGAGTAG